MDAVQFLTRLAGEYHEYGLYASATLLRPPLESLSAGQSGPLAGGRQEAIRSIEVSKSVLLDETQRNPSRVDMYARDLALLNVLQDALERQEI